jgi:hypothetical protein
MGGFSEFKKLQTNLGTENTGDRIALFNELGQLVGYIEKSSLGGGGIPLSGTEVGSPITGDLYFDNNYNGDLKLIHSKENSGGGYYPRTELIFLESINSFEIKTVTANSFTEEIDFEDTGVYPYAETKFRLGELGDRIELRGFQYSDIDDYNNGINSFKGIVATDFYNKQSDPKAFAQLGDVGVAGSFSGVGTASTNFTVTLPTTQPNNTYKVRVTPTNLLTAVLFYVANKTTTTFDVIFVSGLTGTVEFDWSIMP